MPSHVRHLLIVAAAAALVFFTGLGSTALWDDEEPRNATVARAMLSSGDWIVPIFNGQLRTDKPPLTYWLIATAQAVFGETEFAARFWSALFAVGACLLTYRLGTTLFHSGVGLWSGLALATALWFGFTGRSGTADSPLIFFTTCGLCLMAGQVGQARDERLPWRTAVGMYAMLGLAGLCRGPAGLILPTLAFVGFSLWKNGAAQTNDPRPVGGWGVADAAFVFVWRMLSPTRIAAAIWSLRPLTGLVILSVLMVPWFVAVHVRTEGMWTSVFFGQFELRSIMDAAASPVYGATTYLPSVLAGFFPWSIFLPLSLIRPAQRVYVRSADRAAYMLLLCWLLTYVVVFACCDVKVSSFALPAYPVLAVLVGAYLEHWFAAPGKEPKFWMRAAFVALAAVGAATLVGMPIATSQLLPGETQIGLPGLIPLVGGCAGLTFLESKRYRRAIGFTAVTAVMLSITLFGFVSHRLERFKNTRHLVEAIRLQADPAPALATFGYAPASLVYYSTRPVKFLYAPSDVATFFAEHPRGLLIATTDAYGAVRLSLPPEITPLSKQPRFLLDHEELILLGRATSVAGRSDELQR